MAPISDPTWASPSDLSRSESKGPAPSDYELTLLDTPLPVVSLFRQLREQMREPRVKTPKGTRPAETPLPLTDMPPWYSDMPRQLKSLFPKEEACPVRLTSRPIEVPEIWQDFKPHPGAWGNALLVHVMALTALILPVSLRNMLRSAQAPPKIYQPVDISLTLPAWLASGKEAHGGGGGGDRSPLPTSKGAIPEFRWVQLAPPRVKAPDVNPLMPVSPSLLGAPELKLPEMKMMAVWGDPMGVVGPYSNGPGANDGIGTGEGGGDGPGKGPGYGPGEGGNAGGGTPVYGVGRGVTAPVVLFKPEPAYSEEARKAKCQGTVTLWIVVDELGRVFDVRVVKPLGMGLDEKAVEAVQTWRFKPGYRSGVPIPVRVAVEVSFRLF